MEIYLAYGVVSAIMLIITIVFYSRRNWLVLRKNVFYILLLVFALAAVFSDLVVEAGRWHFGQYQKNLEEISGTVMGICLMLLYMYLLLYDLAVAGQMRLVKTTGFRIYAGLALGVAIYSSCAPFLGGSELLARRGEGARGNMLQVAVLAACLLLGLVTLSHHRRIIPKKRFLVLTGSQLLLLFDLFMQLVLEARNLASYYTLTAVLVSYYILLHNVDRYRAFDSACFDRDGFNRVLAEHAWYKENFTCLGICINNIESITNYCTEAEIAKLHQKLGRLLRKSGGRHAVYQIHSFEYMIMLHGMENAEKKHELLKKEIPAYFRINTKNIAILCSFYTVEFADAGYNATEFNRTIASMRKLTMGQLSRSSLLHYHGENQQEIQNELEALRVINHCISQKSFGYRLAAIQGTEDRTALSYELILQETLKNGTEISQERIWELASEAGYIREVGYIAFDILCRVMQKDARLQRENCRLHINLLSSQLASTVLAEEYIGILKSHSLPGNKVCIELTIDRSVDYDKLVESFVILQGYGITLLLDQFGVNVCNLKQVLNMPFDSVKINHHMVRNFCEGKSSQLIYMVRMLKAQGWTLYLDGIDEQGQLSFLEDMKLDYIQGMAVQPEKILDLEPAEKAEELELMATPMAFGAEGRRGGVLVHE